MKSKLGFTLVELLVVIAIIAILAGIVIPNVPKYINKARATRAQAEIKGIDLALTKMLTDVGRTDFK
ncbi:MAG TPA: prepilin-type N-terminal cleavage/methylation domain-containing protein, partial [Candidatus Hydrogenedentes bacterium]|nr:prepilin-type N-terminal cleavage/methylation domain-containing protein [Candidatus Hydrogenedentota bacterium]